MEGRYGDVSIGLKNYVAVVEIHRPPHNYFDFALIRDLADAFTALDNEDKCRASVLVTEGKSFCAGANFVSSGDASAGGKPISQAAQIYEQAARVFACEKPIVAAIQGAAIGGGLGLALAADFRIVSPNARFSANFVKLGIHPGFGLTFTLPRVIGLQRATLLFYTGQRINAEKAVAWGLAEQLVPEDELRIAAGKLAAEVAENAPLAVRSTRKTMRRGLAEAVKAQTAHELVEQDRLRTTEDHQEGVKAVSEKRPGRFVGR